MSEEEQPTILITTGNTHFTDRRGSPATDWVVSALYAQSIRAAGGFGLVLGPSGGNEADSMITDALRVMDGLLITGGAFDIHPSYYHAESHPSSGPFDDSRTSLEVALLKAALKADKPILGICGGMQLLNVVQGGTLIQDLSLLTEPLEHEQRAPRSEPGHTIKVAKDTLLHSIVGVSKIGVNSTHHQVIGELGSDVVVSAKASDDVIEAIEYRNASFALGVQWHPEAMEEKVHQSIFEHFIRAAKIRA